MTATVATPVMVMAVMMPMVVVPMVVMVSAHRALMPRRIGDGLHGHLGDRRSPDERGDGERRNGNAWKLHVVSLVRWFVAPTV